MDVFLIEDFIKKENAIRDKVSGDSEFVYNKELLKTKIRSHSDEVTHFHDKEIPRVDSNHTCLAVISFQ